MMLVACGVVLGAGLVKGSATTKPFRNDAPKRRPRHADPQPQRAYFSGTAFNKKSPSLVCQLSIPAVRQGQIGTHELHNRIKHDVNRYRPMGERHVSSNSHFGRTPPEPARLTSGDDTPATDHANPPAMFGRSTLNGVS